MAGLHPIFVIHLERLEPGETFVSHGVRIQSSSGRQYYFKTGSSCDYEQWAGEATSLVAMRDAAPGIAPQLYAFGLTHKSGEELDPDSVTSSEGVPYFLSAYSDHGSLSEPAAIALGKRLGSEMHRYQSPNGKFGFEIPTYCGATRFSNGWYDSWAECYSAMIGEMLGYLKQRGKFQSLQKKGEELRQRVIPHLLESLNVQPVLLHGDLWSGNVGANRKTGEPVIFDAASYYGHNEADLGITRMFGGIPKSFFKVYHEHLPKTEPVDQYELRAELYELFHHINHTVLFGGGYASGAERKIDNLLRACP